MFPSITFASISVGVMRMVTEISVKRASDHAGGFAVERFHLFFIRKSIRAIVPWITFDSIFSLIMKLLLWFLCLEGFHRPLFTVENAAAD